MSKHSHSKCQLYQMHIDAYLDGDLEPARVAELRSHLDLCVHCSAEVSYAEKLHTAVIGLPILNCTDAALEPVDRLFAQVPKKQGKTNGLAASWIQKLIGSMPGLIRYGVPISLVLLLSLGLSDRFFDRDNMVELATVPADQSPTAPQFSQAEVIQALHDLETAIDYLGQVSQRTNVMIEHRFLLRQLDETIRASFGDEAEETTRADNADGPI